MKIHRIYGLLLHYYYIFIHSYEKMIDTFYWPVIDLLLWGLTSSYIQKSTNGSLNIILTVITGIVFWSVFWKAQYSVSIGLLDELWNKNLVNLFVAPLKFSEWIASWMTFGLINVLISFSFTGLLAYLLYKANILTNGIIILPYILVLLLSGWTIGFLIAGIILRHGSRVQTLAWSLPWLISPFSAIYYPVKILPFWAIQITKFIPTSYVFEGIRHFNTMHTFDSRGYIIALSLSLLYFITALYILRKSFTKALNRGIIKLY